MRLFQQNGCKTWRVRFSICGRQFDEPLRTRNKEVAREKARRLILEREREMEGIGSPKLLRDAAKTPLPELLENWLAEGLAISTNLKHRKNSKNRTLRLFGECEWKFLRDVNARSFEAWRKTQERAGLSPKTLNEYLGHVRCFLNWLESREMTLTNPLKVVKQLSVVQEMQPRAFSLDELKRLLEASSPYRACTYTVAAFTGLRKSELRDLEWSSVHLDGEKSVLRLSPKKTKNRKGGTLPIHPDAISGFEALRDQAAQARTPIKRKGLVFYRGIVKMPRFLEDLETAGIQEYDSQGRRLDFHALRKTWGTFLVSGGAPPRVAMELMRHNSLQMTMRNYTDSTLLPLSAAVLNAPSVKSSLKSSLLGGKTCPKVGISGEKRPSSPVSGGSVTRSKRVSYNSKKVAEGVGFEPTEPCGSAVFKTAAIDHSATPP